MGYDSDDDNDGQQQQLHPRATNTSIRAVPERSTMYGRELYEPHESASKQVDDDGDNDDDDLLAC